MEAQELIAHLKERTGKIQSLEQIFNLMKIFADESQSTLFMVVGASNIEQKTQEVQTEVGDVGISCNVFQSTYIYIHSVKLGK